ncbi:class I SAM-dependent methyltransferase [Rubinisphaera sp.]|uniref:class I SAM-dependent methyltransferase n=1 Tax=Rubinisphaera sp. TaxID=2024857 RepID=UPI000C1098DD|nr:class I SAM-dependent methyltransferase [Rubinisphaera sp.]MBV10683.1 methyltransferase [Rubinisphaera sp.]
MPPYCPLCNSISEFYHRDISRLYFQCLTCSLVFVDRENLPTPETEKRHYDLHENRPEDAGYRKFLSRLFTPMNEQLNPSSRGLDFGCGPGPTLSLMFAEAGHSMEIYDPFYAPDQSVLNRRYDFITVSEAVEHFHEPQRELSLLWSLLKPQGWLGIMTKRVRDLDSFRNWHYKQDPTHVCFYSLKTFRWLADAWKAELIITGDDVILIGKRQTQEYDINSLNNV